MASAKLLRDPMAKTWDAKSIVSPTSRKHLGVCRHDVAELEGGLSKAVTDPTLLLPVTYKAPWRKCWVRKLEKTFLMYAEHSDKFVLSARKVGTHDFLISQYDAFPELHKEGKPNSEQVPNGRFCAVLRRTPGKPSFKLFSLTCQNCDDRLGRYSCDALADSGGHTMRGSPAPVAVEDAERQLLMEISQSVLYLERAGVNARVMKVDLPGVSPADGSRVVWCPRCPRGSHAGRSARPRAARRDLSSLLEAADDNAAVRAGAGAPSAAPAPLASSGAENRDPGHHAGRAGKPAKGALPAAPTLHRRSTSVAGTPEDGPETLHLRNRLPKWSDDIGSLTMKFLGSRVADSSSKNFLFDMPTGTGAARPVVQFGKLSTSTFSLDFRFPLSPIQALGMFLSANAWTVKQS